MAYAIARKKFPGDIALLIVSFLPKFKKKRAKYWKDEACRNMSKVLEKLDISQKIDNHTMNFII